MFSKKTCFTTKQKKSHILKGMEKHLERWHGPKDNFARDIETYVKCWEDIVAELQQPTAQAPSTLQEGFWASTDWTSLSCHGFGGLDLVDVGVNVTHEDDICEPYCGPKNEEPRETINP